MNQEMSPDVTLETLCDMIIDNRKVSDELGCMAKERIAITMMAILCYASEFGCQKASETFPEYISCFTSVSPGFAKLFSHMMLAEVAIEPKYNESFYVEMFNKWCHKTMDDCEVVDGHRNIHNIPDSWVRINGVEIPVEVKLGKFNKSAMMQLNRYMREFNCKYGVAVGRCATVDIPENVFFVSNDDLDMIEATGGDYDGFVTQFRGLYPGTNDYWGEQG